MWDGFAMKRTMNSRIIILSFTRTGTTLNRKLCEILNERKSGEKGRESLGQHREDRLCLGYAPEKYAGSELDPFPGELREYIGRNWGKAAYIFIGAAGIAVRYIAPWVKDKYTDSAVLVIDEKGKYVIPLLSGHIGGAAALADEISELLGAAAVHTTATDVQGRFAVDVFAKRNDLMITDREMAKKISAAVLEGEKIAFYAQEKACRIRGNVPPEIVLCTDPKEAGSYQYRIVVGEDAAAYDREGTLVLKPVNIAAGIGCRRGTGTELLEKGLDEILRANGRCMEQVKVIASIDLKKDEQALVHLSEKYQIPFLTYTAEELQRVREVSSGSEFVEKVTGIDNVCERAARLCCGDGEMIQEKAIRESMTAALVKCPVEIIF